MKTDFALCANEVLEKATSSTARISTRFYGQLFHVGSFTKGEHQYIYGDISALFGYMLESFDQGKYLDYDVITDNFKAVKETISGVADLFGDFGDLDIFGNQECVHVDIYQEIVRLIDRLHQADLMEKEISHNRSTLKKLAEASLSIIQSLGDT